MMVKEEVEGKDNEIIKNRVNRSMNKDKGNSLEKFRKLLLADIVQSRIKTPKLTLNKREGLQSKKI